MRYSLVKSTVIAALSVMSMSAANASTISGTYVATGSNFSSTVASPFASITESFTISFNNAVLASQQTAGITLNASTITPTSTLAYTYVPITDTLIVGGLLKTVATSDPASTDFAITISNASSLPNFTISALTYTVGTGATFTAGTRTVGAPVSAVPEPASMALLGTAAALFACVRRRRINH